MFPFSLFFPAWSADGRDDSNSDEHDNNDGRAGHYDAVVVVVAGGRGDG